MKTTSLITIIIICLWSSDMLGQEKGPLAQYSIEDLKNDSIQAVLIQNLVIQSTILKKSNSHLETLNNQLTTDLASINKSNKQAEKQSEIINKQLTVLMSSSNKNSEQQYTIIRDNIKRSAQTYALLTNVIEQLEINVGQNIKNAKDNRLSNPESGELGFKLSEKIEEFAKISLFKKESNLSKFMTTVSSITESELVKNITPAPALGIANSVINLLHGISFSNKKLDTNKINAFEEKFTPYILYYQKSSIADDKMISSNEQLISQLNSVSAEIINHFNDIVSDEKFRTDIKMIYREQTKDESNVEFLQERTKDYTEILLDNYFDNLENEYSDENNKYKKILEEKSYLKDISNNLDELIQYSTLLEFLEKEYFNVYTSYNTSKVEALKIVPKNDNNKTTIESLITDLSTDVLKLMQKEKKAINLKELLDNIDQSKYSIKLI